MNYYQRLQEVKEFQDTNLSSINAKLDQCTSELEDIESLIQKEPENETHARAYDELIEKIAQYWTEFGTILNQRLVKSDEELLLELTKET